MKQIEQWPLCFGILRRVFRHAKDASALLLTFALLAGALCAHPVAAQNGESITGLTLGEKKYLSDLLYAYRLEKRAEETGTVVAITAISENLFNAAEVGCASGSYDIEHTSGDMSACESVGGEFWIVVSHSNSPENRTFVQWFNRAMNATNRDIFKRHIQVEIPAGPGRSAQSVEVIEALPVSVEEHRRSSGLKSNKFKFSTKRISVKSLSCTLAHWKGTWNIDRNTNRGTMTLNQDKTKIRGTFAGNSIIEGEFVQANSCIFHGTWERSDGSGSGRLRFIMTKPGEFSGVYTIGDVAPSLKVKTYYWNGTKK